jgi:NADH-quinone oxidoreductase subunit A
MPTLVYYLLIFLAVGVFFLFIHLVMGSFIRPRRPGMEKLTIYECGEPTVGSAWIQFDVRYYVVALLFVVFDVEVAFFFPWAIVFGSVNQLALAPEPEKQQAIVRYLETGLPSLPGDEPASSLTAETAKSWAWVAFLDILVFFFVLMVGFAYLWRRGDIDWVRSTVSERAGPAEELPHLPPEEQKVLVSTH